jgi:hypothetical protein
MLRICTVQSWRSYEDKLSKKRNKVAEKVATIAEITQGSLLLGENLFSDKKLPLSNNG